MNDLKTYFISLSFFALGACNSNHKINEPKESEWLREYSHLEDTSYEQKFEEAYTRYLKSGDIESAGRILCAKGRSLDFVYQPDSSYLSLSKSFLEDHADDISDATLLDLTYSIGSQYDMNSELDSAKTWLLKIESYKDNPEHSKPVALSYLILSDIAKSKSNLPLALEYAHQSEKYFMQAKDTANLAAVHAKIVRVASSVKDLPTVKESVAQMKYYAYAGRDTDFICMSYLHEYMTNQVLQGALSDDLSAQIDTLGDVLSAWSSPSPERIFLYQAVVAKESTDKRDFENAESALDSMRHMAANQPNQYRSFVIKDLELQLDYARDSSFNASRFEEMKEMAVMSGDYFIASNLAGRKVDYYSNSGDYQKAFQSLQEQYSYRDSLWNDDLKAKLFDMEQKYQTAKKEKKIAQQKQTITKRNYLAGTMGLGLVSSILLFVLISNRRKRKALVRENQLQEDYSEKLLDNVEAERSRIAGELHDDVNHQVLQLSNKAKNGEKIEEDELTRLMEKVRRISHELFPAMFEKLGLQSSINELCQRTMKNTNLKIATHIDYSHKLSTKQELQIYRIIQEGLNNTLKHSAATHAIIKVLSDQNSLVVSLQDNGKGFKDEINQNNPNFGIAHMRQRAKSIKGKISIDTDASGTTLNLLLNV